MESTTRPDIVDGANLSPSRNYPKAAATDESTLIVIEFLPLLILPPGKTLPKGLMEVMNISFVARCSGGRHRHGDTETAWTWGGDRGSIYNNHAAHES